MPADYDPRVSPWTICDCDFPRSGPPAARLQFLVRYAILAPSGHNTQPWRFKLEPDRMRIVAYADRNRGLPVVDPGDRELVMSIGAALCNLRVAAAHLGHTAAIEPLAESLGRGEVEPVAAVTVREGAGDGEQSLAGLYPAIARRRTNRAAYQAQPLAREHLQALECLAGDAGTGLCLISQPDRQARLAELIADGERRQMANPAFRAELAGWVRANAAGHGDGVAGDGFGVPDLLSWGGSWYIRSLDLSNFHARRNERMARTASALAIIYGPDGVPGLLAAGDLLERFALIATSLGLQHAYLNQPIEVGELRPAVREVLSPGASDAWPQLMLRAGYAPALDRAMPRRRIEEVLIN